MNKIIKFINKHLFFIIALLIIALSWIWYWGFAIKSGDLVQILVGMCWLIMVNILVICGLEIDFMRQDMKDKK